MTITGRTIFLRTGISLNVVLLGGFITSAALVFTRGVDVGPLIIGGIYLVLSLAAVIIFHRFFKRITSPEAFFVMVFLLTVSFEAFRGGVAYLSIAGSAPYFGELFTRAVLFGRYFGIAALFSAGLLSTGIPYRKHEVILGLCGLASFALAAATLVDQSVLESQMLYRAGIRWELSAIGFALEAFALINFTIAAMLNPCRERIWMTVGIALMIVSTEILHRTVDPVLGGIALGVFTAGTVLFGVETYSLYYWS